jgi:hypothetical protein
MDEAREVVRIGELSAAKEYPAARVKVDAFMVEKVQWKRIRRRVGHIEASHAPEWLLGLATLAAGVAASAGIALLVLPHATNTPAGDPSESVIASGTRPALWAALIAGIILASALGGLYRREHKKHSGDKTDLQDEMDTIETAWEQSAAARVVDGDGGRDAEKVATPAIRKLIE